MAEDKNTHRWVLPEGASTWVYLAPGEELPEGPEQDDADTFDETLSSAQTVELDVDFAPESEPEDGEA